MKIEWINQGKDFEIPKINVEMELEILKYLEANTKDMPKDSPQKNYLEFIETVYQTFHKIDKTITRDIIKDRLTAVELGTLFVAIRTKEQVQYSCPHCKKSFTYAEMNKAEGDIPLSESK